jgi:hypothetical protein
VGDTHLDRASAVRAVRGGFGHARVGREGALSIMQGSVAIVFGLVLLLGLLVVLVWTLVHEWRRRG